MEWGGAEWRAEVEWARGGVVARSPIRIVRFHSQSGPQQSARSVPSLHRSRPCPPDPVKASNARKPVWKRRCASSCSSRASAAQPNQQLAQKDGATGDDPEIETQSAWARSSPPCQRRSGGAAARSSGQLATAKKTREDAGCNWSGVIRELPY